jgi:hypothetical protein
LLKKTLDSLGMSNYWLDNLASPQSIFKSAVKNRIKDQFMQKWNSSITVSSICLNYRMFKEKFEFEDYLDIIPSNRSNFILRYRSVNHKFPIEQCIFFCYSERRKNNLCNTNALGDEFQYIFVCDFFQNKNVENIYQSSILDILIH